MKKLILIGLGLVFLSGCSGVKQFTVKDFADATKEICSTTRTININVSDFKEPSFNTQAKSADLVNRIAEVAVANSKTGCSANITPTSCSVSCGGSDTPIVKK